VRQGVACFYAAVGLNLGKQGGVAKLDWAMNPNGGAILSALNCTTNPGYSVLLSWFV
jgi:hypothetical protein